MLRQIAPAHILHLADVGLQDKILGIGGELPELLQGSQAIKRLLNSGQEVTVFRGKSGKRLGRCRTTSPVRAPAPPPALFRRTCSYSPHRPDGRYSPHRPGISRRRCKPRAFPPSVHLPAAPSGRLHPPGSRSERRLVLVTPVDQDVKIVARFRGHGDQLLVTVIIVRQRGVALRGNGLSLRLHAPGGGFLGRFRGRLGGFPGAIVSIPATRIAVNSRIAF